jgi:hypothetical protein
LSTSYESLKDPAGNKVIKMIVMICSKMYLAIRAAEETVASDEEMFG